MSTRTSNFFFVVFYDLVVRHGFNVVASEIYLIDLAPGRFSFKGLMRRHHVRRALLEEVSNKMEEQSHDDLDDDDYAPMTLS
jgi:hypothetical protein